MYGHISRFFLTFVRSSILFFHAYIMSMLETLQLLHLASPELPMCMQIFKLANCSHSTNQTVITGILPAFPSNG